MKSVFIDNDKLINQGGKCYNPSLIDKNGRLYLVYRYEPNFGHFATEIAVVQLSDDLVPISGTNKKLKTFRYNSQVLTIDDPRAVMHRSEMYAVVAHGRLTQTPERGEFWDSSIVVTQFNETGDVPKQIVPWHGNNLNSSNSKDFVHASEKNWSPFIHAGELMLVYSINPLVVLQVGDKDGKDTAVSRQEYAPEDFAHWTWGDSFSGGTNLIRIGDEYVGLFHTFLNVHPHEPNVREYYSGSYAISADAPFRITKMSHEPVLYSKMDDSRDMRPAKASWRPNVCYPCGIMERNGKILVSYGWQDCRCAVDVWEKDEFLATLKPFPCSLSAI